MPRYVEHHANQCKPKLSVWGWLCKDGTSELNQFESVVNQEKLEEWRALEAIGQFRLCQMKQLARTAREELRHLLILESTWRIYATCASPALQPNFRTAAILPQPAVEICKDKLLLPTQITDRVGSNFH